VTDAPVFHDAEERRLYYRELGLKSLFHFIKIFGSPVRQGGDISPIIHKPICEFVSDDDIKRKGVAMPRKLRKTTICDRWKPIWDYLRDPEERILLGAETLDIASASMDWIRGMIMQNELLRWCYPEIAVTESWTNKTKWSGVNITLPRQGVYAEPTFKALGVGGASQSRHMTRIYLSDIFGAKGQTSEKILLNTIQWWENLPELLVDGINGIINLDFTFWAVGDPHQWFMDNHPEYHWRIVPALRVDDATSEKMKRNNKNAIIIQNPDVDLLETNFPDIVFEKGESGGVEGTPKFPTDEYKKMMASAEDSVRFWTQHMNAPELAGSPTNTFLREWLKYYHIGLDEAGQKTVFMDDDSGKSWPLSRIVPYGFIDPGGFGDSAIKGGRCAAIIVGRAPEGRRTLLLWTWTKRIMRPSDLMKAIYEAHEKFKPRSWRVETVAAQKYIYRDLLEENQRQSWGMHISEYELRDTGKDAKNKRIIAMKGPAENGEIYVQRGMNDFMYEWTSHGGGGITMDLLDCLSLYYGIFGAGVYKVPAKVEQKQRYKAYLEQKNRAFGGR